MSYDYLNPGVLVGLGNPLLDFSTQCPIDYLQEFDLTEDTQIEVPADVLKCMIEYTKQRFELVHSPGGSVQNTMRVLHWLYQRKEVGVFIGSVGEDQYADILEQEVSNDGVDVKYIRCSGFSTGSCIGFITGDKRTLCANLGAANQLGCTNFLEDNRYRETFQRCSFIYLESFLLTHSNNAIQNLVRQYKNKYIILNLSAVYVCDKNHEDIAQILPYCFALIGNKNEFFTLFTRISSENQVLNPTCDTVLRKLLDLMSQPLPKTSSPLLNNKIVVMTAGDENITVMSCGQYRPLVYEIESCQEVVVDTTGAGDAFAAGFLSQLILRGTLDKCITHGVYAAKCIIRQRGCRLPNTLPDWDDPAFVATKDS